MKIIITGSDLSEAVSSSDVCNLWTQFSLDFGSSDSSSLIFLTLATPPVQMNIFSFRISKREIIEKGVTAPEERQCFTGTMHSAE